MPTAARPPRADPHADPHADPRKPPPADPRAELRAIAADCALEPDAATLDRLLAYLELLAKWNAVYNLTAIRDPAQMLVQHLADSLAIVAPLRERGLLGAGATVLDVGSGAGLPGVVLAACEPLATVRCVDAVHKKSAFVTQVAGELRLANLHAVHARVESLHAADASSSLIVSRAFASLAEFVGASAHLLAPGGRWAAMKGRMPDEEIAALAHGVVPAVVVEAAITLRVPRLDAERCLIVLARH